ncbi:MAG: preprotein translocase subunit YajC [Muribaculaceae bacterium]|nr:preprotein translocase subunit YajC [Muribaculaceae bacterium]
MMLNTILLQAADAGSAGGGSSMMSLLMIVVLIAIFYFFMIAPQQKKQKKINAFRDSLQKGDKVMTAGGIYGRIREIKDNYVMLEIDNNVTIKIDKNSIYQSMQDVAEAGADVKK